MWPTTCPRGCDTHDGCVRITRALGSYDDAAPIGSILLPDANDRLSGVARNVLTWLAVGLTIWLSLGALAAQLFGAFVNGGRQSWEDEHDH